MKCTESQSKHWVIYALHIAVYKMSSHELIPLIKIILEKVTGPHLDAKFSHLNGIWCFITVFTRVCYLSLSCARCIQPMHSHLPSMPVFSKCCLSLRFSHHNYWVGNTNHAVLHYAIFSSLLVLPFISQISCSVSSAWKPSTLAPPLMWETKFYNHVQQAF